MEAEEGGGGRVLAPWLIWTEGPSDRTEPPQMHSGRMREKTMHRALLTWLMEEEVEEAPPDIAKTKPETKMFFAAIQADQRNEPFLLF